MAALNANEIKKNQAINLGLFAILRSGFFSNIYIFLN